MVDLTPSELSPGTVSDDSVVHASQDDDSTFSRKHKEVDISRLRSAIMPFNGNKTYKTGDLVTHINILWRAIGENSVTFEPEEWEPVGPTLLKFEETRSYGIGALIIGDSSIPGLDGIQLRSKAQLNPGTFDRTDWEVADGVGSQNVVQIFTEGDFPTPSSGIITLQDGIEYIICAPITVTDQFLLPTSSEIMIRAFADETNKITYNNPGLPMFTSVDVQGTVTSFSHSGTTLTVVSPDTTGLMAGDLVNVRGDDQGVDIIGGEIGVVNAGSFTVINQASGPTGAETNGFYDQGPAVLELEDLVIEGAISNTFMDLTFAHNVSSEFFTFHVVLKEFGDLGVVRNVGQFTWDSSSFEGMLTGFNLEDVQIAFLFQLSFLQPNDTADTAFIIVTGELTEFVDIAQCFFDSNISPDQEPLQITGFGSSKIGDGTRINVTNCTDIGFETSFFDTALADDIDEKDPRMFVDGNNEQKDSVAFTQTFIENFIECSNATGGDFLPVVADSPMINDWQQDMIAERFTMDNTATNQNGKITYVGREDIDAELSYSVTASQVSGDPQTLQFALDLTGSDMPTGRSIVTFVTDGTLTQVPQILSQPIFIKLVTGTEIRLIYANTTNTTNSDIKAIVTITPV